MRIVISNCVGGFDLSATALSLYYKRKGIETYWFCLDYDTNTYHSTYIDGYETEVFDINNPNDYSEDELFAHNISSCSVIDRSDPDLIAVIEKLGRHAHAMDFGSFKIIDIPDDIKWHITYNDDGSEYIAEDHRVWR